MSNIFHYNNEQSEKIRLDQFLAKQQDLISLGITRSRIQKLINGGMVKVNDGLVKANHKLSKGDVVELTLPAVSESELQPEDLPLAVLYEDQDVIVLNKAAGMVVHPTDSGHNQTGTLVNALLFHCKDLSGIGGQMRPGIVHRLDKGTSGVMVVAKNDKAHQNLSEQIQSRKVNKTYLTLVRGALAPRTGTIEAPVGRSFSDRKKMAVVESKTARMATTHYKIKEFWPLDEVRNQEYIRSLFDINDIGTYTFVEVDIVTGRTHQIRVHFQSIGFPVVGDEVYGDRKVNNLFKKVALERPFLHAWKLGFALPSSGEWMEFEAPLAPDLVKVQSLMTESQV